MPLVERNYTANIRRAIGCTGDLGASSFEPKINSCSPGSRALGSTDCATVALLVQPRPFGRDR